MKKIWAVQLDMVQQFKKVCEKYGLCYFMYAGTLIGAIRHQGYIPWDDDFDIIMPRRDYDIFKSVADKEFKYPYFFQTNNNTPSFFSGNLSRLRNSDTTAVEYWDTDRKGNWGIWVDVIAFDYIYADPIKRKKQLEQVSYYQRLNLLKTYGTNFLGYHDMTPAQKEVYAEIAKASDRDWLLKKFEEACSVCEEKDAFYVGSFTRYNNMDYYRCWYKADFESSISMRFEGIELPAPIGYDRFLRMSRGNYMELPSIMDRIPKHEGIYEPEQPFAELQRRLTGTFENLSGKKIIVFGSGEMFDDYMNRYGEKFPPDFLVDNDKKKWGRCWKGFMVEDPELLKLIPRQERHIIICNRFYREIEQQLKSMDIDEYYLYIQRQEWLDTILYPDGQDFGEPLGGGIQNLIFRNNCRIMPDTGHSEYDVTGYMATEFFYKANPGSYIELLDSRFEYAVATYSEEINGTYIYTYSYEKEENWSTYNHDLREYQTSKYKFGDERYFRISIKKRDNTPVTQDEANVAADTIIRYVPALQLPEKEDSLFESEILDTVEKINVFKKEDMVALCLLTDTHYCINGTWEDTVRNVKEVHKRAPFDGIIHLGDLTDGMVSAEVTKAYVEKMLNDINSLEIPSYILQGNHDANYFRGNQDIFTKEEQYQIYQKRSDPYVVRDDHNLWYYADFSYANLRCLFLDSFDHEKQERYGFPDEEIRWVQEVLAKTPPEYRILIFSHVPPTPEIHIWSETIRNGESLLTILENQNRINHQIIGFIHGHNHTDQIFYKYSFPIISIGCNKCEYFSDKKPKGSTTPQRKLKDIDQDLWDVLLVNPKMGRLRFVRFGAGEDRIVMKKQLYETN